MSDISVNEADLIVLLQELESRGVFRQGYEEGPK